MNLSPPAELRACIERLDRAGHRAWAVGGCVRDALLGNEPADWDLCSDALPDEVRACFAEATVVDTGLRHGTVTVVLDGRPIEITTFRVDGDYPDHRRPASVRFTRSLREDLARRDFTVNAMAWREDEGLFDPFGGQEDLASGLLRCVGDPMQRFGEDALRILRLFRFAARLGFSIHPQTLHAAAARRALLREVSAERVAAELAKLVTGDHAEAALCVMADHGVLAEVLPELAPCIGFDQRSPNHDRTVDRHIFAALGASANRLPVRLALLLHDSGKPAVFFLGEDGFGHCHGHAAAGAEIARGAMRRLRYPRALCERVELLVRLHMDKLRPDEPLLRRLLSRHGADAVRDMIDLKLGDVHGRHPVKAAKAEELKRTRDLLEEMLSRPLCLSTRDLAVDGGDLIALGAEPGPALGKLLGELLELVLDDPARNRREHLLAAARERLSEH